MKMSRRCFHSRIKILFIGAFAIAMCIYSVKYVRPVQFRSLSTVSPPSTIKPPARSVTQRSPITLRPNVDGMTLNISHRKADHREPPQQSDIIAPHLQHRHIEHQDNIDNDDMRQLQQIQTEHSAPSQQVKIDRRQMQNEDIRQMQHGKLEKRERPQQQQKDTRRTQHRQRERREPPKQGYVDPRQRQYLNRKEHFREIQSNVMPRDHEHTMSRFASRRYQSYGKGEAWSPVRELEDLKTRPVVENPTLIVILAYMHTGSTYVGSVFQNHPGTFYEYEPLRSLQAVSRSNDTTMFLNGTTRLDQDETPSDSASHPDPNCLTLRLYFCSNTEGTLKFGHIENSIFQEDNLFEVNYSLTCVQRPLKRQVISVLTDRHLSDVHVTPDIGTEAVENMLLCRHEKLDMTTLIKHYWSLTAKEMRDTGSYFRCQGRRAWRDTNNTAVKRYQAIIRSRFFSPQSKAQITRCLPLLTYKCKAAEIKVSKFIRMTVNISQGLLERLPSLKIVHLLRDPRAMMDSQVRKADMGTRVFSVFVRETILMCWRMLDDITRRENLERQYPGRIMTIRYEDILEAPMEAAESMFNFTGLSFTQRDAAFVRIRSIDSKTNSTQREAAWKFHLEQTRLEVINQHCKQVYDKLGYIYYENMTDIQNFSNPTYIINPKYSSEALT